MSTFHDFFGGAAHVDIDSSDAISFDNLCCFTKHGRIFPKDLDDEWVLTLSVC